MAVQGRRRRTLGTLGTRMRDFSRSVMRHYSPSESDAPVRPQAPAPWWASGLPSPVPSAPPPAVQRTPIDTAPDETGVGQLPLLPIDPITTTGPQAPIVPDYVPREVFVAQPRSEAPVQRAADNTAASEDAPSRDLPTHYEGRAIPVDSRPVDPAIKRHMQLTREREAKVEQNREQRLEQLLSEVPEPPAPEETATQPGRRIRPRGHIGVEYVQTKALADKREPTDHSPSSAPEPTPREPERKPETVQRSESTDDDEVSTSGPVYAATHTDAIQRAIESAEAPTQPNRPISDAPRSEDAASEDVPSIEPSAAASPIQRAVSVDEALAFEDDAGAVPAESPSPVTGPAPVQRSTAPTTPVPLDQPVSPEPPQPSDAQVVQRSAEQPDVAMPELNERAAGTTSAKPGTTAPPDVQRASAEPARPSLPFDSAPSAVDSPLPADESSPVQRLVEDSPATDAPQPPVERVSQAPSTPNSGPVAAPHDSAPTSPEIPSTSAPLPVTPSVQRVTATSAPIQPDHPAASESVSGQGQTAVQRTPEAPGALPFDDSRDRPTSADPSADTPSIVQRAADSVTGTEPAAAPTSSGLPAPVQRDSDVTSPPASIVPRTPEVPEALPHDAVPSPPDVRASGPRPDAPVQRTADEAVESTLATVPVDAPSESYTAPPAAVQRTPDGPEALPHDAMPSSPDVRASGPRLDAPIQRTADEAVDPAPAHVDVPSESHTAPPAAVQRETGEPVALPYDAVPSTPEVREPGPRPDAPVQRTADEAVDSVPATASVDVPSGSNTAPPAAVQRETGEPVALPYDAPDPSPETARDTAPAVQRAVDRDEAQTADKGSLSFEPSHHADFSDRATPAAESISPASSVQRAPDAPMPLETPSESPSRPAVQDAPVQGVMTPPGTPSPTPATVQRTPDLPSTLPFDVPSAPQKASSIEQRMADEPAALPVDATPSAPDGIASPSVQREPESASASTPTGEQVTGTRNTPEVATPAVQRAPDTAPALPFDAPPASEVPPTPSPVAPTAAPTPDPGGAQTQSLQRTPDEAAARPSTAPVVAVSAESAAPVQREVPSGQTFERPSESAAIAGNVTPETTAPRVQRAADDAVPLPFDAPEHAPAPVRSASVQRAADDSAPLPFDNAAAPPADTRTAPVQRASDVHDVVASGTPAESAPAAVTREGVQREPDASTALPFDTLSASPSPAVTPGASAVQRRTDPVDGRVFAVSSPHPAIDRPDAHPIGRPRNVNRYVSDPPVAQRAAAQSEPAPSDALPFDPIQRPRPPEPPVQRMPDVPAPTNPYAGMDLRQAMIAAGMIAPSPSVTTAQASSQSASIQREESDGRVESESDRGAGYDDNADDTDIDVDKLAEDVMHVLRRRLRNEFDRLTGTNR